MGGLSMMETSRIMGTSIVMFPQHNGHLVVAVAAEQRARLQLACIEFQ